ncbi:hypothetical protein [Streptomyces sp. ME19-01-6]|uniref:hypothetical protein n=1 Tax=Streptomyces sp. ME19-01-6 TaxID=3028686 RepID=UPI0029B858B6|nr:hypothetical protein [Streptomyces sp. ME19-01-6]MDX3230612.1 hypothetical protein [Streptomyces sp. ME19-01-6]
MPDLWNGKQLPDRRRIQKPLPETINYRLYDQRGQLLSFNSTNSLASLVADVTITAREHPNARIHAVQYDGPA